MLVTVSESQYLVTISNLVAHVCGSVCTTNVGCPEIFPRLTNQRFNGALTFTIAGHKLLLLCREPALLLPESHGSRHFRKPLDVHHRTAIATRSSRRLLRSAPLVPKPSHETYEICAKGNAVRSPHTRSSTSSAKEVRASRQPLDPSQKPNH